MTIKVRQIGPGFAGEVVDFDTSKPPSKADADAIHTAMDEYAVLVFHDQKISKEQQLAFTQSLGEIEYTRPTLRKAEDERLPATFADVSNLDKNNKPYARDDRARLFLISNRLWHSDSSYKVVPSKYSLLYASSVTSRGGNTEFADMRAAYDALDEETKAQAEDLVCEHSQVFSRSQLGFTDFTDDERAERYKPVLQRLVRTHPVTKRKSLYLSSHGGTIVGWPLPEAKAFLRDLNEAATQREFVYAHKWKVGDLVMWDNRTTMHRTRPYPNDEPRDMRRTTVMGDAPTVAQQAA